MAEILTYRPEFKSDFVRLNEQWLTEFFTVEQHDKEIFENIETLILEKGGQIFFCLHDNKIIGTVALQPNDDNEFELSKMAIDKNYQGLGLANMLLTSAINYALEKKANKLYLLSNTKLTAAINLYKKFGFKEVRLQATDYQRADIQMELATKDVNVWEIIPLRDYEKHMMNSLVGQLLLLNQLTKKYLDRYVPEEVLFLGIAGGNGLEHIHPTTKRVIGVDINDNYLKEVAKRFAPKIKVLELLAMDITKNNQKLAEADLIWAALIAEYTGIDKLLAFASSNVKPGGHVVVTIQSNNGIQSVSPTGVESVKIAALLFESIDPVALQTKFLAEQYAFVGEEENFLPNGKSLRTYDFVKI